MNILFQSTSFSNSDINLEKIIPLAREMGFNTYDFGNIPFTNQYTNLENIIDVDGPFLIYGSTKVLKSFSKPPMDGDFKKFFPDCSMEDAKNLFFKIHDSLFYDEQNFDQAYLIKNPKIKEQLLNGMGDIYPLSEIIDKNFQEVFIKPSADLKYFNGGILLNGTVRSFLDKTNFDNSVFEKNPTVLVSPLINIASEYRFFIIDGKISTFSLYKVEDRVKSDPFVPEEIKEYAKKMISLYQPSTCFVIDVALLKNKEMKIVEYNCFNCSGLYQADMAKYLNDMSNYLTKSVKQDLKKIKF